MAQTGIGAVAVPGMRGDLGVDLQPLLPEAGQRPVLNRLRLSERAHEIGEIV